MRLAVFVALALSGCGPKEALPPAPAAPVVDPGIEVPDALAVLEEGAASMDPTTRGHALAHLVATDPASGAAGWADRGLWDPQPWVQQRVVDALARRGDAATALQAYVARDSADPYGRAAAAAALGHGEPPDWRPQATAWDRAPVAFAALVLGDERALQPLTAALAGAEVAMEVGFLRLVGRSGLPDLLPALITGAEWVEPELALPWAGARFALGDAEAESELRRALTSGDEEIRLDALDVVTAIDGDAATDLIHRAATGSGVSRAYADLALAARGAGDPEALVRAAASPEREVRDLAMRFAVDAAETLTARRDLKALQRAVTLGLADEDASVRAAAFRALPTVRLDGERAWLPVGLTDEYLAVQVEAAGAARKLGP